MAAVEWWDTCVVESCTGIQTPGADRCLRHLSESGLGEFIAKLRPGADLDMRGTTIDKALLDRLLRAVCAEDGSPELGAADFQQVRFTGSVSFRGVRFAAADFRSAHFKGIARFENARFEGDGHFNGAFFETGACFDRAVFAGRADFRRTSFWDHAGFVGAGFEAQARFDSMVVHVRADFSGARFLGTAGFGWVYVKEDALFTGARFESEIEVGPLEAHRLHLDGAVFRERVEIVVAAGRVSAERATFAGGLTLRAWYALIDLDRAVLGGPSTVVGLGHEQMPEDGLAIGTPEAREARAQVALAYRAATDADEVLSQPKLMSVAEADVSGLSVVDVDLRWCRFEGARHLDQLRIEGRSGFGVPPRGVHIGRTWPPVWRWTRRGVLAEERAWRASQGKPAGWLRDKPPEIDIVPPERLVVIYRALRKSLEDSRDEPGAADFYYGEMEMRRHSAHGSDRLVLSLYWLLSGYGLRATRALLAAAVVVAVTTTVLLLWGMPHPTVELALRTTISAIAFRDPGPSLTAIGVWTVMAARILGTLLLALAVLAVRGRVKR